MNGGDLVAAGDAALAMGDWSAARDAFQSAWDQSESADALDGLGRALWWLGDPGPALDVRARAFAQLRRAQRDGTAAAVAVWMSRQYRNLYHRDAMADGWLTRARSLLEGLGEATSLPGWVALAESEAARAGSPSRRGGRERRSRRQGPRRRRPRDRGAGSSRRSPHRHSSGGPGLADLNEARWRRRRARAMTAVRR
jgi:hypothetical protein